METSKRKGSPTDDRRSARPSRKVARLAAKYSNIMWDFRRFPLDVLKKIFHYSSAASNLQMALAFRLASKTTLSISKQLNISWSLTLWPTQKDIKQMSSIFPNTCQLTILNAPLHENDLNLFLACFSNSLTSLDYGPTVIIQPMVPSLECLTRLKSLQCGGIASDAMDKFLLTVHSLPLRELRFAASPLSRSIPLDLAQLPPYLEHLGLAGSAHRHLSTSSPVLSTLNSLTELTFSVNHQHLKGEIFSAMGSLRVLERVRIHIEGRSSKVRNWNGVQDWLNRQTNLRSLDISAPIPPLSLPPTLTELHLRNVQPMDSPKIFAEVQRLSALHLQSLRIDLDVRKNVSEAEVGEVIVEDKLLWPLFELLSSNERVHHRELKTIQVHNVCPKRWTRLEVFLLAYDNLGKRNTSHEKNKKQKKI